MRLSTVILPHQRWHDGAAQTWRRAEELGFDAAYTYDHLSWRSFRDSPWLAAVPTLSAAAVATKRIRLGTMVTSPNFRHPVTLAKDLVAIDDLSGGRITLGIGAGGTGYDAETLGGPAWSRAERTARFEEFVDLLDGLLRNPAGYSAAGEFYSCTEARNLPGCVQQPRIPLAIAGNGPRGLRLAAAYADAWVCTDGALPDATPEQTRAWLRDRLERLDRACADAHREVPERILLTGFSQERPLDSPGAFADFAGVHAELGFTEIVVHWPIPDSQFAADLGVFEQITTAG